MLEKLKSSLSSQLVKFAVVGGIGFLIDAGILTLLTQAFLINVYLSRLASFSVASLATWLLNRLITFRERMHGVKARSSEYGRYVLVQVVGATVNLAVFVVVLGLFPQLKPYPVIPLAIGAIFGLVTNFTGAHLWVYVEREKPGT